MKYLFTLLLIISVAHAQFAPTSTRTAFKNGIALGTRDSTAYGANDSLVVTIDRNGRLIYRSTDGWWKLINTGASMVYPGAGIPISTGSAWGTSITDNSTDWNTAFSERLRWDGGATGLTASTGRTSLGGTTVGQNLFTLTNPSAITFPRFNADNTVSALDAASFRSAIGAGTGGGSVTSVALSTGTTGTDVNISGSPITSSGTITVNIPTASASNRGALSSTDWSTFNNKIGGTLVSGRIPYANGTNSLTTISTFYSDGTRVYTPELQLSGNIALNNNSIGGGTLSETLAMGFLNRTNANYRIVASDDANGTGRLLSQSDIISDLGLVTITGTQTISGAKTFSAITNISNTTASTSTTTGALTVAGGAGVAGALNVGGRANFSNQVIVNANSSSDYGLVASGTSGGARQIFIAGQAGFSNGFTVDYNGTNMVYAMNNGNLTVGGAANFSSSVQSLVYNINADGAGVVLQGHVDNTLRIAARGSGYNSGARGGLVASTGDFSGWISANEPSSVNVNSQNVAFQINNPDATRSPSIAFGKSGNLNAFLQLDNATNDFSIFTNNGNTRAVRFSHLLGEATFSSSVTSEKDITRSLELKQTTNNTSTTLTDQFTLWVQSSGSTTYTLPLATGHNRIYYIRKINSGTLTVNISGSDVITLADGTNTTSISRTSSSGMLQLISDGGTTWYVMN